MYCMHNGLNKASFFTKHDYPDNVLNMPMETTFTFNQLTIN